MQDSLKPWLDAHHAEFTAIRRDIHAHPELGLEEVRTSRLVADALRRAGTPRSAAEVSEEVGISRATAQRYLASLAQSGRVLVSLRYGSTGRPEHEYAWGEGEPGPPAS